MSHSEFEELIGRKADEDEYELANTLYLHNDLSKRVFCAIWNSMHVDVKKFNSDYRD